MTDAEEFRCAPAKILQGTLLFALLAACARNETYPEFGFEASYVVPCPRPEDGCCSGHNCGEMTEPWIEGPHADFGALDPRELARASLDWLETTPESARWREDRSARIQLLYSSGGLHVTVRHVPDRERSWEAQLRAWFERFPPGGERTCPDAREFYDWHLDYHAHGVVRGHASSDSEAVAAMTAQHRNANSEPAFAAPSFDLLFVMRRTAYETDVYSESTDDEAQVAELPERVRAKFESSYAFLRR